MAFASCLPVIQRAATAFKPPQRLRVSEGAHKSLMIRQPGGYSGPWSPSETPYMVEPIDKLSSRAHEALCFVGPARTGKTMGLLDGWVSYIVTCDPGDMLVVQMSQDKAREFSKTRIDRAIRHSPALNDLMSKRGHDDNTHDKLFRHGMWLKIGWPTASQLSSTDYRYVALTDYDRFPDNIDGEGSAYALGLKRTQTFMSRGMCMVESSPGREYTDPHWRPATPHEAPPSTGILGIYSRSDRRRWYWACLDCHEYFEAAPGLSLFAMLPPESDLLDIVRKENLDLFAKEHAKVVCPHCGSIIEQKAKATLNSLKTARWAADGQRVERGGHVVGAAAHATIAGYWLGGVAAAYQQWDSLVLRYLHGLKELVLSGSDLTLKSTVNTDQGMPYLPRHLLADAECGLEGRVESLQRYHVPDAARFLVASVDVQGGTNGRFVVEVRAFGPYLESWLVDRYSIAASSRDDGKSQIDPAGYPEDWDILTRKVVTATYRTSQDKELRVLRTAVDTGGEQGVSANAYAWFRRVRREGLSSRVMLVKGVSTARGDRPVVKSHARNNIGKAMRDLPLWLVDTTYYKDIVSASMRRRVPGPGYFHPPAWLHPSYFDELKAEVRMPNGRWKQIRARNEALDLWVYALAVCESLGCGAKGAMKWETPPAWAAPLHEGGNSEMIGSQERREEKAQLPKAKPRRRAVGKPGWGGRL